MLGSTVKTAVGLDPSTSLHRELLHRFTQLRHSSSRARFLATYPELLCAETVQRLTDLSRDQAKMDPAKAFCLAKLAMVVARRLSDRSARALGLRAMGNALYASGQNHAAIAYHQKARRMFATARDRPELARTLSASIQPLILTGQYKRALANAKLARQIFAALKDDWRLARLDLNTGNIFHRQDRFEKALKWYRRAHRYFFVNADKDLEAMGVALHNIAMCLVSLNDFPGAMAAHQEARAFAEKHGMNVLVAQTDYNIAALHYMRGEHSRAIRMLHETLETCRKANDLYHFALCHLDLSEIYLQLNLNGPAEEMAEQASVTFKKLGMNYEAGKSLVNLALAVAQQNQLMTAMKKLTGARRQFVREKNSAWPFLIDFYQAIIMTKLGRYGEAIIRCRVATRFFLKANIPEKQALGYLLSAQLCLLTGRLAEGARTCSRALAVLNKADLPLLLCQAHQLMGQILMKEGKRQDAYCSYQQSRTLLETLRNDLALEELRISFMENRLEIYESLVRLCLKPECLSEAFTYIEHAKSRSLQDLMSGPQPVDSLLCHENAAQDKAREIRAEIKQLSRRFVEEQLRNPANSSQVLINLQNEIRKREKELLRIERVVQASDAAPTHLNASKPVSLNEIQACLAADCTLLEYFQIQDQILVAIVTRRTLSIEVVTKDRHIIPTIQHLEFQLSKFRFHPEYTSTFGNSLLQAIRRHLQVLYTALLAPIVKQIVGNRLIIVPHGALHRLPFQAFFDGQKYLIDEFAICYAPSASIYHVCGSRAVTLGETNLVMGVPDAAAPLIRNEATAVAGIIPQAHLLLDEDANLTALEEMGPNCRFIHIASHGYHRHDSPMFSGVRLSDSILTLYDLYRLKLAAQLVTLSGCSTGISTVAQGDELLGLVRGLLCAGARAALLTLWDVKDQSTLEFMSVFYTHLVAGAHMSTALQRAVWHIRNTYPHPYFWAPFNLVGNIGV